MAEQRLIQGLSSWLRDSDVPPPDARMSASRVIAGVELTPRLGRFWPPVRLAPSVEPAAELGAYGPEGPPPRPVPRVQKPRIRARVREAVTPVRALAVASVVALACSMVFLAASMLPRSTVPEPETAAAAVLAPPASALPSATPASTPAPTLMPTPAPTQPPTWAPSDRVLDWQGRGVRMEADSVRVAIDGRAFTLPVGVVATSVTEPGRAQLDGAWMDKGVAQRLVIEVETDGSEWWFRSVRTYDGRKRPAWITFGKVAPEVRTLVGESYEGDLRVRSTYAERKALRAAGSAHLRIDGLRLTAFGPEVPLQGPPG